MKKSLHILFTSIAVTAALAACTREVAPTQPDKPRVSPQAEGTRVIAVSFGKQRTRTTLGSDGLTPKFSAGDSILISNGEALDTCAVEGGGDNATISTDLTGPLTAVYPYKAAKMHGSIPCRIDTVLVSTEQDGTFASANICMAKNISDEAVFENKTALFCITPGAGDDTRYVEVSAESFHIANDIPTGSACTSYNTIHVATTGADSVWVSILVPDGLTVGNLSFYDGINEKTITDAKAAECVAVNTLYKVNGEGWETPRVDLPDYVEMNKGTGADAYARKWATKNLGATEVATDYRCYGDYYQWGSVEKLYTSITWTDNKDGSFVGLKTKGFDETNLTYTEEANLSDETNDVVRKTYPGTGWRMPTSQEFRDLYDACVEGSYDEGTYASNICDESTYFSKGVYWCGSYCGVAGCLFVDEDGDKLFFPAAGDCDGTALKDVGSYSCYWSSTGNGANEAYTLAFDSGVFNPQDSKYRHYGLLVRPVLN